MFQVQQDPSTPMSPRNTTVRANQGKGHNLSVLKDETKSKSHQVLSQLKNESILETQPLLNLDAAFFPVCDLTHSFASSLSLFLHLPLSQVATH